MDIETANALKTFTTRYCDAWHDTGHGRKVLISMVCLRPALSLRWTTTLSGSRSRSVEENVNAVERAMDIVVQPAVHAFYTTQFAGDMPARFGEITLTLLQTERRRSAACSGKPDWSSGHAKRLKLSPTLFIATLDSELDVISVCNLSGEVIKETIGTRNRETLAPHLRISLPDLSRFCNPSCYSACERSLTRFVRDRRNDQYYLT